MRLGIHPIPKRQLSTINARLEFWLDRFKGTGTDCEPGTRCCLVCHRVTRNFSTIKIDKQTAFSLPKHTRRAQYRIHPRDALPEIAIDCRHGSLGKRAFVERIAFDRKLYRRPRKSFQLSAHLDALESSQIEICDTMAGKQAKILSPDHIDDLLFFARHTRSPLRDRVIVLLSAKAGLRAGEIAKLAWPMVLEASGGVSTILELHDSAAKKQHGRLIPLHPDLRAALSALLAVSHGTGSIVQSGRGLPMKPLSIVIWFQRAYRKLGFEGCSSHSGRRTFITRAARNVHKAGGSLRDVQMLAGHRSIQTTQRYIEGDSDAQRRLISLL